MTVTAEQAEARIRLQIEAFRLMSEDVKAALAQPIEDREDALRALVEEAGGKLWFTTGTHQIRLGKVSATSTVGYVYAADNWLKAAARASKKLEARLA